MIQVAIVEDIADIREGWAAILDMSDGFHCTYTFANAETAFLTLKEHPVDVVLMDIKLPGMSGIECMKLLKPMQPQMQFMVCTVYEDDEHIFNALKAGATGYILKKTEPGKMLESIRDLYNGGSPMNALIARKIISSFQKPGPEVHLQALTQREQELLQLLAQGLRYKEIAVQLSLSTDTVRTHIRNIYRKLEVQSRTEAINKVYKS